MFDYIVCFYFGKRRVEEINSLLLKDKYFLVKIHLDFLKNNPSILNDINYIALVINNCSTEDLKEIESIKKMYSFSEKIVIINRDNSNYSYGAFNEALKCFLNLKSKSKYGFLCEDDYVPCNRNFFRKFLEFFDKDVLYVCQLWSNGHAAISNGFINYKIIKKIFFKTGEIFNLKKCDNTYSSVEVDQVNFLSNFENLKCLDISPKYRSLFISPCSEKKWYGKEDGEQLISSVLQNDYI
jgi:hypothetical protein